MKKALLKKITLASLLFGGVAIALITSNTNLIIASSHREAPLISNDPLADNTDLYAFRNPSTPDKVTIIANYVPAELPQGGPNYYSFGENIRYEIHVKNGHSQKKNSDDIIYRFTFNQINQDPTTFFNIRLGKQNLKTTYTCERSIDAGLSFQTIATNGIVPPNNIGPRSIDGPVGLGTPYATLMSNAITQASTGEQIFCGPVDDPFFVDLGGVFDLGQTRSGGTGKDAARDALACKNVHSICLNIPISTLQKDGRLVSTAANILDPEFIIGVWANASRQQVTVLDNDGGKPKTNGKWIQVSRIGMPLTNEAVIPIGDKDYWNSQKPFNETYFEKYFTNPELALYMDNSQFGGAVPALSALRIQRNSLQQFDFGNTHNGLYPLLGNPATTGTALDPAIFGNYLLRANSPRSVDILPIFMTGVPNLPPYQLATGKNGNPLAAGKPFINNFLPTFGDMLRLNMAVPPTDRSDPAFSSLGLIQAAVLGLTNPTYNSTTALQFIPNMDGFPNGRRLEDDVTRIELQAVGGAVLAAIGLWYDDYTVGSANPVTPNLIGVLSYTTGVEQNDTTFKSDFPFVQTPWNGYTGCKCGASGYYRIANNVPSMNLGLNITAPVSMIESYPNPAGEKTTFKLRLTENAKVSIKIFDIQSRLVSEVINEKKDAGTYQFEADLAEFNAGIYYVVLATNNENVQTIKLVVSK